MNPISSPTLKAFRTMAEAHSLWEHEFLVRCRTGQLTLSEVKLLAVQMYKFSQAFNRILASIMSCCPDESAQLVILENLFDEMGEGDSNRAHPALFRYFTRELGIDDATLEALPTEPETIDLIETYLSIPHQYGYLAGLGAVCFASEGIVKSLYTQLQTGIMGAAAFPKESLIFFDVHIDLDDDHADKLRALLAPRIETTEQGISINRAILEAMDARVQFFNGIGRQAAMSASSVNADLFICA